MKDGILNKQNKALGIKEEVKQHSRRDFMRLGTAMIVSSVFTGCKNSLPDMSFSKAAESSELKYLSRDKWGGCPDIRFKGTGFFRLEKANRWWFVTPEGNAYLSFGVNHVNPGLMQRKENREYWLKRFGLSEKTDRKALFPYFHEKVKQDLGIFGFNSLGCHSPTSIYEKSFIPYIQPVRFVDIPHWKTPTSEKFLDVFSQGFVTHCNTIAQRITEPRNEDPYLIGYSFTDCPIFTDVDAAPRGFTVYGRPRNGLPTWPRVLRNLGPEHAGKAAYIKCVRAIYRDDIEQFNRTYSTEFKDFNNLLEARNWRPEVDIKNVLELRDNKQFLSEIIEKYYRVCGAAIRKYDTNHMIFGDKLNGNTNTPEWIVLLVSKYTDLIFYQMYGFYKEQHRLLDRWSAVSNKPLFNGDSTFSVPDKNMSSPYGPHCRNQDERARSAEEFARRAFARKDFVGWSVCGWMDSWESTQKFKQHSGLQDPFGSHYKPMVRAFSEFSKEMYRIANG